jgi:hypothetical protein
MLGLWIEADRWREPRLDEWARAFWSGFAILIGALQLLHLVMPIGAPFGGVLLVLGAVALFRPVTALHQATRDLRKTTACAALVVLVALALASFAVSRPAPGDTWLYHQQVVMWTQRFPIVPGLGNLHHRFAYNNAHFLYVAAHGSVVPSVPDVAATAAAFLGLLSFIAASSNLCAVGRPPWQRQAAACALLLPAYVGWSSEAGSSIGADHYVFALHLVCTLSMLQMSTSDGAIAARDLRRVLLLVAAGVAVKLSFAAFGVGILLLLGFELYRRGQLDVRTLRLPALLALAVLLPWTIRGAIISGWPLYPIQLAGVHTDWAMPQSALRHEAREVIAWARAPGQPMDRVLADWHWFRPWLARVLTADRRRVVLPLLIALLSCAAVTWHGDNGRRMRLARMLAPTALGLVAWFLSAPDPRFAGGLFAIAMAVSGSELIELLATSAMGKRIADATLIVCCAGSALLFTWRGVEPWLAGPPKREPIPGLVDTRESVTRSGLVLHTPNVSEHCGIAPLPCTPSPDPSLALRRQGDLGSGFRHIPTGQNAHEHQ